MTTTPDRTTELPRRRTVTTTVQPIDDVRRDDVPVAVLPDVAPVEQQGQMSHRQILEALSGMLLAMFVAFLSSTVVSNALPTIITDLRGTQGQYTWVVTATLLASTASTPIWGKLADLFSKKLLIQLAIVIFIVGSMLAGLSQSVETLIAWRVLQGLGLGGLQALVQIAMAAMISPRERGRYSGLLGGVMAVATVGGPLLGGLLVDTSWLGWRWCFYVGVPFAAVALVLLQRTLHLPVTKRDVHIDYLGAAFLTAGVSALLIWVTLAGDSFAWMSTESALFVGGGVLAIVAFVVTETRAKEPIVPLRLFQRPDDDAGHRGEHGRRCGDVRLVGLPRPVPADLARLLADGGRPADHPDGRRAAAVVDRVGHPDHQDRPVEALPGGRLDPASSPASGCCRRSTTRRTWSLLGVFLFVLGVGHRHDDAEPRARRAEHRGRHRPRVRRARRWRSSAASAARSASRCWARC